MPQEMIKLTPSVLMWARETAGMTLADTAVKLKLKTVSADDLAQWENGDGGPTYLQLEKIASLYRRPVALFFFPEPPQEKQPAEQFRSLPKSVADKMPTKIRFLVRDAMVMQDNLYEIFGDHYSSPNILKELRVDGVSAKQLAGKARKYINLPMNTQFAWQTAGDALKAWRDKLETVGVWIFKDAFRDDDYSGFCLHDKQFPIIYINNSMSPTRQIFTIFHELAHLLRGKGGVDMRQTANFDSYQYRQEEAFCNAFAAEFLVPDKSFLHDVAPNNRDIENLCNKYKVSREVIWRKFYDKAVISKSDYQKQSGALSDKFLPSRQAMHQKSGGDYYATKCAYLGKKYLRAVFGQYRQHKINERELADYVSAKTRSLENLEYYALKE